jgi:hypothetical protein
MGILCLSYVWLIHYFLTDYTQAVIPLIILSMGLMILETLSFPNFFLNVADRFATMITFRIAFILINTVLDVAVIKLGFGIVGVALVSTFSYLLYAVLLHAVVFRHVFGQDWFLPLAKHLLRLSFVIVSLVGLLLCYYSFLVAVHPHYPFPIVFQCLELLCVTTLYLGFLFGVFSIFYSDQRIGRELVDIAKTIVFRIFPSRLKAT